MPASLRPWDRVKRKPPPVIVNGAPEPTGPTLPDAESADPLSLPFTPSLAGGAEAATVYGAALVQHAAGLVPGPPPTGLEPETSPYNATPDPAAVATRRAGSQLLQFLVHAQASAGQPAAKARRHRDRHSFREEEHPRDAHGRFIKKGDIVQVGGELHVVDGARTGSLKLENGQVIKPSEATVVSNHSNRLAQRIRGAVQSGTPVKAINAEPDPGDYVFNETTPAHLASLAQKWASEATDVARNSPWHGEAHWKDVSRYAMLFADNDGGDKQAAFVFGAMHDTQRLGDYDDPGHGPRAADKVLSLRDTDLAWMSDSQIEALAYGLRYHDAGQVTDHPTIGAMWDGDRVTLWRVGIAPAGRFMSTSLAQQDPGIAEGDVMHNDLSWDELALSAESATDPISREQDAANRFIAQLRAEGR